MTFPYMLGRQAATHPIGYRSITHYAALPDAPAEFDHTGGWNHFQMLGNGPDPTLTVHGGVPVGDCAFVGTANVTAIDQIETNEAVRFPTADDVVSTYLTYDRGKDMGANLSELLAYWHNHGLPWAGRCAGYASVNPRDTDEFWAAVNAYGCGYIGVAMTQAMQQATQEGNPWDFTGSPADYQVEGGHCVVVVSRMTGGGEVVTWGMRQRFTDAWLQACVEEAHVVITPAQVARHGDGYGLDIERLEADLADLL